MIVPYHPRWLEANCAAHPFIPQAILKEARAVVREALPAAAVHLYLEAGKPMGFLGIVDGNHIAGLFVRPGETSRGIGCALLGACQAQYPRLTLYVFQENQRAVSFYRRHGFSIEETRQSPVFLAPEHHMTWP